MTSVKDARQSYLKWRFMESILSLNSVWYITFKYCALNLEYCQYVWHIYYALRWMPGRITNEQSTLVWLMACCRRATNHYLSQCWPRFLLPYTVSRLQSIHIFQSENVLTIIITLQFESKAGSILLIGSTLIPPWINNHMQSKMYGEMSPEFPNFSGCTGEIWEWISNFIPHSLIDVITYPS